MSFEALRGAIPVASCKFYEKIDAHGTVILHKKSQRLPRNNGHTAPAVTVTHGWVGVTVTHGWIDVTVTHGWVGVTVTHGWIGVTAIHGWIGVTLQHCKFFYSFCGFDSCTD